MNVTLFATYHTITNYKHLFKRRVLSTLSTMHNEKAKFQN